MSSNHQLAEQIAIYALGALAGQERMDLEAHLRECASCRAQLGEARAVVNLLPRSVGPIEPSPETKRKLFARVDVDLARSAAPRAGTAVETRSSAGRRPPTSTRTLAFGLVAIVVLVLVGLFAVPLIGKINQQREIAAILNNPNAQVRVIGGTKDAPTAQAKLVAAPGDTRAVLVVDGLKPLPPDKTYEFWLIRGTQPFPAGLFDVDANGSASLLVAASQSINAFDKLGVTIEQRAGEQTPKGTLVLQYGF
jgi:anti-sigma-K factor RskA